MTQSPGRQDGFTLLELLVALSVFALLSVLLFEAMAFGGRVWAVTVERGARQGDIAAAQEFLRGRLEQLYPSKLGGHTPAPLAGEREAISFLAPAPFGGAAGFYRYDIRLSGEAPARFLVLRWRPERSGAEQERAWTSETLLERVATVSFSYLRAGEDPEWSDRWTAVALPALIRMEVASASKGADWPALVIRPLVSVDAACVFDLVAMGCRS